MFPLIFPNQTIHSFTLNFVKKLFLIFWPSTTNLIKFYWFLLHVILLTQNIRQFFVHHNSKAFRVDPADKKWEGKVGWTKNLLRVSEYSVPDVAKQKFAFQAICSQMTNDFVSITKSQRNYC